MDRAELTGHTALGLVALVGFFVYTASYSLVYHVLKSGSTAKPVAVLELWMVFTHLLTAGASCLAYAVFTVRTADVQTSVFLGVALSVTFCGGACINDPAQCAIYFPAAAWAPLAAAGAIAWSWIVYLASLGCQTTSVSLGASTSHLIAPIVLALVAPAIAATLKQTCGLGSVGLLLPLGLHGTLLALAFVVWNGSHFMGPLASRALMRALAAVLLVVDAFLTLQGVAPWACVVLACIALSDGQITAVLFGTGAPPLLSKGGGNHPLNNINNKRALHMQ